MRGHVAFGDVRRQPSEVNDPAKRTLASGRGERARHLGFCLFEVRSLLQRVHQVVRDVDVLHRPGEVVAVGCIAGEDFDLIRPREVTHLLRATDENTNAVAAGDEFTDEPSTDVSGGAGD